MKKTFFIFVLSLLCTYLAPVVALAQTTPTCVPGKGEYCSLTTLPHAFDKNVPTDPIKVIKNIYGISIAIAAILAVAIIIWAGIEYVTVESISGKSDAKERWTGALWGLGLLLSSFIILRTINFDLVNIRLDLGSPEAGDVVTGNPFTEIINSYAASAQFLTANSQAARREADLAQQAVNNLKGQIASKQSEIDLLGDPTDRDYDTETAARLNTEINALKTKLTEAETVSKNKASNLQSSVALATVPTNMENITKSLQDGDVTGAKAMRDSTLETLNRLEQDTTLSPTDKIKVQAAKLIFTSSAEQQIQVAEKVKSIGLVTTVSVSGVTYAPPTLATSPVVQKNIADTLLAISTDYNRTMTSLKTLGASNSQIDVFKTESLNRVDQFKSQIAAKVGCTKGITINTSAGTASCIN